MKDETRQHIIEQPENAPLREWHKPEIERLTVSLDTGIGAGSVVDGDGREFSTPSDRRLKRDIAVLDGGLRQLLTLSRAAPSAQLIPLLAEAIKQQQVMIADLQTEVEEIRKRTAA